MINKVYVVQHGELNEGGDIVSVHRNKEDAVKVALSYKCCFPGGWILDGEDIWINGCDFVLVNEQKIL